MQQEEEEEGMGINIDISTPKLGSFAGDMVEGTVTTVNVVSWLLQVKTM